MTERNFIQKIIDATEEKFGCLCYAVNNPSGNRPFWNVCIDDYDLYRSAKFKKWNTQWYNEHRASGYSFIMVFCYCRPIAETLWEYAQNNNLIINV